uniref:E3 ubiquitin-protein ligase NRDP1 n=1 Tax=Rhipicephalus appendiculatus TaxID=34631 RepID=A0A131YPM4_RHIAP
MASFGRDYWMNTIPFSPSVAPSATRIAPRRTDLPTDAAIYSVENFEPRPPPELVCSVCLGVYRDPVECPCRHVFCSDCIHGWLVNGTGLGAGSCPVCRQRSSPSQLMPVVPIVNNMIARLKVRCPNHATGCNARVAMEHLNHHIESCPHRRSPCPDCGVQMRASELSLHQRERCPKRQVRCDRGCGLSLSAERLSDHNCIQEMRNYIASLDRQIEQSQQQVQRLQRQVDELTATLLTGPAHVFSGIWHNHRL